MFPVTLVFVRRLLGNSKINRGILDPRLLSESNGTCEDREAEHIQIDCAGCSPNWFVCLLFGVIGGIAPK